MKRTCFTNPFTLGLIAILTLVGCTKTPVGVTAIPGQKMGSPEIPNGPGGLNPGDTAKVDPGATGGIPQVDPSKYDNYIADAAALAAYTVHFEFDSASVKTSEESKVAAVAESLKGQPTAAVRIEGHCDERGTEEYNRSLGDRRANALREKLAAVGVDAQRIVTRSYGEDRPIDPGHTEAAWSKNRRGEFILLTPPK